MATRTRKTWKPQRDGQFVRQLGWKRGLHGRVTQPKFRLGTDLREAKRREMMLSLLWEFVERSAHTEPIMWPPEALEVAKQLASHGRATLPKEEGESNDDYAIRVLALADRLPGIPLLPADAEAFREELAVWSNSTAELVERHERELVPVWQQLRQAAANLGGGFDARPAVVGGAMLHDAVRDHIEWIKSEYVDADGELTDWGVVQVKQAEVLIDRHGDLPLAGLDHEAVEGMFRFWRQRPLRKGTDRPITKKSAEHQVSALKTFFGWLNRSPKYPWQKPPSFEDIRFRVDSRDDDVRRQVTPDDLFTLKELTLLIRHAKPIERALILLGLNCGFNPAEISTLTIGEVFLHTAHERRHQEILGFASTDGDSFVKRYRRKTGVYGEFILFPQTVAAIEWALARRQQYPGFGPGARLLVNSHGQPLDKPTAGGNPNRQIANRFAALIRRIRKTEEGKEFVRRPFKMLRKTAGDLVRRHSDGEVAAVFQCRGQAVRIDDLADAYTTRPFGKVFQAIRDVEEHLQPMFEAAGENPFDA